MNTADYLQHEHYVLDASSVINLYASGHMFDIIRSLPAQFVVSNYVMDNEALHVLEAPDKDGLQECTPIDIRDMVSAGLLEIAENDSRSIASTVIVLSNSGMRGMGESITGALALENGWGIVLDDKRATNKLKAHLPHIQVLTTLHVVKFWVQQQNISSHLLKQILCKIRLRGRHLIARGHPLYAWAKGHSG